jgi:hypothetical protein
MVPPNGLAAATTEACLADDATATADANTTAADAVVDAVDAVVAAAAVADAELSLRFVTVTVNWLAPPVVCACPS